MIKVYEYPTDDEGDPDWGLTCSPADNFIPVKNIHTGGWALAPRHHIISYSGHLTKWGEEVVGTSIQHFAQCRICSKPYPFTGAKVVHDTEEPPGEQWKPICNNCLNTVFTEVANISCGG